MNDFILDKTHCRLPNVRQESSRSPYPFQKDAFRALDRLKEKHPEGFASMLVLPTGAGKTYTAVHWILKNYIDQGVRVLWIAHRSELLRQAAEAFYMDTTDETLPHRKGFQSYTVSSEFGRSCYIEKQGVRTDVVIASRQSVCSGNNIQHYTKWAKGSERKENRRLLLVFDEAHHAAARSYRTIIDTMKKYIPHVDILGLTATPFRTARSEQGSLKHIFHTDSGIVYSIDMNTLIGAGILSNPIHTEIQTELDMTHLFSAAQLQRIARLDLTSLEEGDLRKLSENAGRNKLIVDTYLKDRKKYGKTIVFAVDVLNAIALNAAFRAAGVASDYVVSSMSAGLNRSFSTERNPQVIRAFRDGKLDVLINVNILTEGTDIPNIQSVFLARPTTSRILMTQMIGRGLRGEAAGGTRETNIVYFIDNWREMVSFVSPKALLSGEDEISRPNVDRREMLKRYIHLADLEQCAVELYNSTASVTTRVHNIIPCGVIRCSYLLENRAGEEEEYQRDIVVYDEVRETFEKLLEAIPTVFPAEQEILDDSQIRKAASELYFRYCTEDDPLLAISSDTIAELLRTYLEYGQAPVLQNLEDRVSLYDLVKPWADADEQTFAQYLRPIWESHPQIRLWFEYDFYEGMMWVYYNRCHPQKLQKPEFILPPKEEMDMGELKKYYPRYAAELRKDLKSRMIIDEEGYIYSQLQTGEHPPYRSKYWKDFEIDHIQPISKGGKTVRENLQMILRSQNVALGAKDKK